MPSRNNEGTIAELKTAAATLKLDVGVYMPLSERSRADLMLEIGERLLRVQCQWAPRNNQRACINLADEYDFIGAVAQLGERVAGSHEVRGSSPLSSTPPLGGLPRGRRIERAGALRGRPIGELRRMRNGARPACHRHSGGRCHARAAAGSSGRTGSTRSPRCASSGSGRAVGRDGCR